MKNIATEEKEIWNGIVSRIKELRSQQGLSVYALAKKTGFTKGYLSHIENLRREPTVGTLLRIANALGVNISYLIDGDNSEEEEASIVVIRRQERQTIDNPSASDATVHESINHKMKKQVDGRIHRHRRL